LNDTFDTAENVPQNPRRINLVVACYIMEGVASVNLIGRVGIQGYQSSAVVALKLQSLGVLMI
jgi:hypothetical protein